MYSAFDKVFRFHGVTCCVIFSSCVKTTLTGLVWSMILELMYFFLGMLMQHVGPMLNILASNSQTFITHHLFNVF